MKVGGNILHGMGFDLERAAPLPLHSDNTNSMGLLERGGRGSPTFELLDGSPPNLHINSNNDYS